MITFFGTQIEVTSERQCQRSSADHRALVHEARLDRQKTGHNVDESYVICGHCVKALSLKI